MMFLVNGCTTGKVAAIYSEGPSAWASVLQRVRICEFVHLLKFTCEPRVGSCGTFAVGHLWTRGAVKTLWATFLLDV